MAALRQMSAAHAHVIRDGERQSIPATEVVPGDIILIEEGDTVPADARLIHSTALQTAEAALTGESLPVSKDIAPITEEVGLGDRHNMIFSGTAATYGRGKAVVTATGMQTQMGRIAGMLKEAADRNHAAAKGTRPRRQTARHRRRHHRRRDDRNDHPCRKCARFLGDLRRAHPRRRAGGRGGAGRLAGGGDRRALALGVQRMAKRNAIVRHLAAVETLGSANVIASDKTGTLTKNEMTVRVRRHRERSRELRAAQATRPKARCARDGGGAIDGALRFELERALAVGRPRQQRRACKSATGAGRCRATRPKARLIVAARKAGLEDEALDARFERVGEVPFSSERKLMTTIHTDADKQERLLVFTKGAPDVLLARCSQELVGEEIETSDARNVARRF